MECSRHIEKVLATEEYFDDIGYVRANPDVEAALAAKEIKSKVLRFLVMPD